MEDYGLGVFQLLVSEREEARGITARALQRRPGREGFAVEAVREGEVISKEADPARGKLPSFDEQFLWRRLGIFCCDEG